MGSGFSENIRHNFFIILSTLFSTITIYILPFNLPPNFKNSIKYCLVAVYGYTLYINYYNAGNADGIEKIYSHVLSIMLVIMMAFILLN